MADQNLKVHITPRARAIHAQLKACKNPNTRIELEVALHAAVGLYPWQHFPIEDLLAELEHEPSRRTRV